MSYRLASKRLYIADLARRQHEMEAGRVAMQPLAYRVLARRLREALAGLPLAALAPVFEELAPHLRPLLAEMLQTRHFEQHGRLPGPEGAASRHSAMALLARVRG